MKASRISLKHIAAKTGYDISTISLALRNHPRIKQDTRRVIQEAAREMGYTPDPALSALIAYRAQVQPVEYASTIAYITKWRDWKRYSTFVRFLAGATKRASEIGYKLEEFSLREPGMTERRCSEILYHRNVQGIIIMPLPKPRSHLHLGWEKFSAVAVNYSLVWPILHRICNSQFRSMIQIVRRLRRYGYKRIGLALDTGFNERTDRNLVGGFLVEQQRIAEQNRIPVLLKHGLRYRDLSRWYEKHRPDVVIGVVTVLDWAQAEAKLRIPEDMGYVHLDCQKPDDSRSGIYYDWEKTGATAVDFVVSQIHRQERGIPETPVLSMVEGKWVDGKSIINKRLQENDGTPF